MCPDQQVQCEEYCRARLVCVCERACVCVSVCVCVRESVCARKNVCERVRPDQQVQREEYCQKSGNEANCTNALLLLIKIMLCNKLHCQEVLN